MKGKNVLRHSDVSTINEMLTMGHTPDEVCTWLKQKHKHRRYWISGVTLNEYRSNFLQLGREQLKEKRRELLASGKTSDVNAIDTFTATKEFVEAKTLATKEIISAIDNFKEIQDKIKERIALIDSATRDADGNPIFKASTEEAIQGYLTRLESMTLAFVKVSNDMKKEEMKAGTTDISINMAKIGQYEDAFKSIMQKILVKLDPSLLNDFITDYTSEMTKINSENGGQVNISINNNGSNTHNISIAMGQSESMSEPMNEQINERQNKIASDMDAEVIQNEDQQNKEEK